MTIHRLPLVLATAMVLAATTQTADAAEGGAGWDWSVTPYVWATTVSTDLKTDVPPFPGSTESDFGSIISKLDGAFLIHVEGQGDNFGMLADFIYIGLGDDRSGSVFETQADIDARVFELAAVWSPGEQRYKGVEVLAGLRYIDVGLDVTIDPAGGLLSPAIIDAGSSYTDAMLGARYAWDASERWGMSVRGDLSFGETEGAWSAAAIAQYRMKTGAWQFGYRHMEVSLEPFDNEVDLVMSGPVIGYSFRF
jgi:hypothetical protein